MLKYLSTYLLAAFLATVASAAGADSYANPASMGAGAYGAGAGAYGAGTAQKPVSYGTAISTKLGTGFSNLILSPLEVPKNIINTTNEVNLALGSTAGVFKGFFHMAGRFMAGIVDVVTFPLPTEPLTTPQYVWDDYKVETRYNSLFKMKKLQ